MSNTEGKNQFIALVLMLLLIGTFSMTEPENALPSECSDSVDNDADGYIDGYDSNGTPAGFGSSSFAGVECGTTQLVGGGGSIFQPCVGWFSESYSIDEYRYDNDGTNATWSSYC